MEKPTDLTKPTTSTASLKEPFDKVEKKEEFIQSLWNAAVGAYIDLLDPETDPKLRLQAAKDVKDLALDLNKNAGGAHQETSGFKMVADGEVMKQIFSGIKKVGDGDIRNVSSDVPEVSEAVEEGDAVQGGEDEKKRREGTVTWTKG